MQRRCELCEGVATLYCPADKAHLCWTCDAKVHSANFLVARHTRYVLCTTCATPIPGRISGANPTPRTGLCADCSQGESQGECATHYEDESRHSIPFVANSSACSSSNALDGLDAVDGTYNPTECPSSPTVGSRGSVLTSVSSCISPSKPFCSQRALNILITTSKQIATKTAFQDLHQTDACEQFECARIRRRDSQRQPQSACTECASPYLASSHRVSFPSKRPRRRTSMSVCPPPRLSTRKRMRLLAKWPWELHLSSPATVPLAWRMFRKVARTLGLTGDVRVTLAACLRVSAGMDAAQVRVPGVGEVAACVGVSPRRLALTEMHVLALLGWRRVGVLGW